MHPCSDEQNWGCPFQKPCRALQTKADMYLASNGTLVAQHEPGIMLFRLQGFSFLAMHHRDQLCTYLFFNADTCEDCILSEWSVGMIHVWRTKHIWIKQKYFTSNDPHHGIYSYILHSSGKKYLNTQPGRRTPKSSIILWHIF